MRARHSSARPKLNDSQDSSAASRRHKPDYWILVLMLILLTIGTVVVYSISPGLAVSRNMSQSYFVSKQLIDVVLGLVAFSVAAYLPTRFWLKISYVLVAAALLGSLIVLAMPVD